MVPPIVPGAAGDRWEHFRINTRRRLAFRTGAALADKDESQAGATGESPSSGINTAASAGPGSGADEQATVKLDLENLDLQVSICFLCTPRFPLQLRARAGALFRLTCPLISRPWTGPARHLKRRRAAQALQATSACRRSAGLPPRPLLRPPHHPVEAQELVLVAVEEEGRLGDPVSRRSKSALNGARGVNDVQGVSEQFKAKMTRDKVLDQEPCCHIYSTSTQNNWKDSRILKD